MTVSLELFAALTKDFPPPWTLHYHEMKPHYDRPQVSEIEASNGEKPITLETYSGDGDMFYLRSEGAEALVEFVNAMHSENMSRSKGSTSRIQGYDFCFEERFQKAIRRTGSISQDLVSPEILKSLEGKRITGLRLRNIHDRVCAPDGTIMFLEIEVEER
jgi:Holliday junction resolvase